MSIIQYRNSPIRRYAPLSYLSELHREMNRLFNDSLSVADWTPALDISHDSDRIQIVVELPGVQKKDLELSLQEGVLTIRGERKNLAPTESAKNLRSERPSGRFVRTIELPVEVDPARLEAVYENGLLTVSLAKAEAAKPQTITIPIA
jgi:HSP20 family protein